MSRRDLEDLLERIDDTREIVLGPTEESLADDGLYAVWDAARREANAAYGQWQDGGGSEAYAAYQAAADREDAAAAALAHVRV
ncbi:MAG: hypothetical protein QOI91_1429 [Solirubrobacteraceae bacterium]|jgi:hypothetical protein|nr:hypothetical protein [Solirubrobacteraceae bacterium]MDX6671066.1 hypothetical protein [Solirubrobacteraceae bacterium]